MGRGAGYKGTHIAAQGHSVIIVDVPQALVNAAGKSLIVWMVVDGRDLVGAVDRGREDDNQCEGQGCEGNKTRERPG
jgi:hypothetical protein